MDAYGALVRKYQDQALAAAYVILGDRQLSEDASQEGFTKAFQALERFRPDGSFRAWLLRIVVNEARDLRATYQRQGGLLSRASVEFTALGAGPSAETASLAEQRREALLRALFELREDDRLVITYRYFLDFSEAEMAEVLGVARGTIKSRLSRAIARLRPVLRDLGPLVVVGPGLEPVWAHLFQEAQQAAAPVHASPTMTNGVLQRLAAGEPPSRNQAQGVTHGAASLVVVVVTGILVGGMALSVGPRTAFMDPVGPPQNGPPISSTVGPQDAAGADVGLASHPHRPTSTPGLDPQTRQDGKAALGHPDDA